jgi:FAD:protein FMN transferase
VTLTGAAMGTTWRVLAVSRREATELRAAVKTALAGVVAEMSHWEPGSVLSCFNAAPVGTPVPLPPDFAAVMRCGLEVAAASGGAFDPAAGRLVDLWGFGPPGPVAAPPGDAAIRSLLRHSSLELHDDILIRTAPVTLDLSGFAKGFAVDAAWRALAALGVTDALVEVGGELRGEGIRPDGQPWWVELETPPGHSAAPLRVALHGLSVATSGDYLRHFTHSGRRYGHTLDPRTGYPVDNGVAAISVLAPDAMTADAWATALHVLGPEGMARAEERGLAARMLTADGELLSSALAAMLDG